MTRPDGQVNCLKKKKEKTSSKDSLCFLVQLLGWVLIAVSFIVGISTIALVKN